MLLKLKPTTEIIGGEVVDCYGIFMGDDLLRTVSPFHYVDALKQVNRANEIIKENIRDGRIRIAQKKCSDKGLHLCSSLGMNRHGLTNLPKVNLE